MTQQGKDNRARRRRLARVTAGSLAAALVGLLQTVIAPAALADGGTFPSNAPAMHPSRTVTGGDDSVDTFAICCDQWHEAGKPGVQYWSMPLKFGDRLTVDFENVTGSGTGLCVLSPRVTDFTIADADCLVESSTPDDDRAELKYTAAKSGKYLLSIYDDSCCADESWAYSMTAVVRHRTTLTLAGPKAAKQGRSVTLHGTLRPAASRRLVLKSKSSAHGWEVAGHPKTNARGKFSVSYHLGHSGRHWFRVFFKGNGKYLPSSSRTLKTRVSHR